MEKSSATEEADRSRGKTAGSAAAFYDLVADFSLCTDPDERERMDGEIWDRFGTRGVAMITDMEGFSATTRSLGICHFLGMIERARRIVAPAVAANHGLMLKCEADNCYAFFERSEDALKAGLDMMAAVAELDGGRRGVGCVELAIGIDYGRLLLVGDEDFYGDPVNTASKLGEDLGGGGEILVTDRALERAATLPGVCSDQLVTRISGIDIQYRRFTAG